MRRWSSPSLRQQLEHPGRVVALVVTRRALLPPSSEIAAGVLWIATESPREEGQPFAFTLRSTSARPVPAATLSARAPAFVASTCRVSLDGHRSPLRSCPPERSRIEKTPEVSTLCSSTPEAARTLRPAARCDGFALAGTARRTTSCNDVAAVMCGRYR